MLNYIKSLFIKKPNNKPTVREVIGKVQNPRFDLLFEWVLNIDDTVVVGSCTVFHTIRGQRLSTRWESVCSDLCTRADMEQAAGAEYQVFTWKELLGETK